MTRTATAVVVGDDGGIEVAAAVEGLDSFALTLVPRARLEVPSEPRGSSGGC